MYNQPSAAGRRATLPHAAGAAPLDDITRRAMVARSGFVLSALALGLGGIACQGESASGIQPGNFTGIDPMSRSPLAEPLVRIGDAIVRGNEAALDAYFAPGFSIHNPAGDLSFDQLKAYWASLRAAFPDLGIRRAAIVGEGNYLAARTIFSGTFSNVFTQSPVGRLQPNGRHIEWEIMNLFRYNDEGRLAEEWVLYDVDGLKRKLGAA